MGLISSWARKLSAAASLALVVPASIAGALLVLALTGGFGEIGSLRQVFEGPGLPAQARVGAESASAGAVPPTPVLLAGSARARPAVIRRAASPAPAGARGTGPARPAHSPSPAQVLRPAPGGGGAPVASSSAPVLTRPASSVTHSRPMAVDRITDTITTVTDKLPGPVGSAATQAVQTVGSTLDKVAAPLPNVASPERTAPLPNVASPERTSLSLP